MRQTSLFLILFFSLFLAIALSCKSFEDESDEPLMARFDVVIDHDDSPESAPDTHVPKMNSRSYKTTSAYVFVVKAENMAFSINAPHFDAQPLDLSTNSVSLLIPYDTPVRVWEVDFFETYSSLGEIRSKGITPRRTGMSSPITISSGTTEKTVTIQINATSWNGTQRFGTSGQDVGKRIATDPLGNIYISGHVMGDFQGNSQIGAEDGFLTKYTKYGERLWTRTFGSTGKEDVSDMALDRFGNIYVVGEWDMDPSNDSDYFLIKYDPNGNVLCGPYRSQQAKRDYIGGIALDSLNNVYVTGSTNADESFDGIPTNGTTSGDIPEMFLTKFNSSCVRSWTKLLDTSNNDRDAGEEIHVGPLGNIFIVGYGTPAGTYAIPYLAKFSSVGAPLWNKQFGDATGDTTALSLAFDGNGDAWIGGTTKGKIDVSGDEYKGDRDFFLAKLDADGTGNVIGIIKQFGSTGKDDDGDVVVDSSGSVYHCGFIENNSHQIQLSKYTSSGTRVWTKDIGTDGVDKCGGLAFAQNGDLLLTGMTTGSPDETSTADPSGDVFFIRLDSATGAEKK